MTDRKLSHYTLTDKIGQGGMGTVYRAHDEKLERDVALKLLPAEMGEDRRGRFLREAKAVAALQHPNIVTLHSVDEADGQLFLTMEFIEGKTLDASIPSGGMRVSQLLETAIPLVDAVAYAHDKGITHRDLKPTNVMVDQSGRVRVLDFGLVKLLEPSNTEMGATMTIDADATAEGSILGTAGYMSPEQAEGLPVDHRTDIFSLGVVLYEMATGKRPFHGSTRMSTISAVIKDEPKPVTELNTRLPRHLGRIIHRCLSKDAAKRYQTAVDLRIDLEGLKEETESGSAITAISDAPASAAQVAPRNKPPLWLVPAMVLALVVAAVAVWQSRDGGSEPNLARTPATPSAPAAADGRTMIVVLPFENLGPPEDAYFSEGVTEEVSSQLASVPQLGVISRTSAAKYADSDLTIPEIGQQLGVDYVIDGSVRWQKDGEGKGRVRVTPQLVRVADDTQLWSNRYDEDVTAIFDVQSRIAGAIVEQMSDALGMSGVAASARPSTENFEAYQAFLKAQKLHRTILADDEEIIEALNRAVELDPTFAEAWAMLSRQHSWMVFQQKDTSEDRLAMAREAADKALELAPDRAFGRLALGYYFYYGRQDYDRALREFESTGLLDSDAETMRAAAFVLRRQGETLRAARLQEAAGELDPKNHEGWRELAFTYQRLKDPRAGEIWERAVAEAPNDIGLRMMAAFEERDRTGDISKVRELASQLPDSFAFTPAIRAFVLFSDGKLEEAMAASEASPMRVFEGPDDYNPISMFEWEIAERMGDEAAAQEKQVESLEHLQQAVAEAPKDWRRRSAYGMALAMAGRLDEARREARIAVELNPTSRDAITGQDVLREQAITLIVGGDVEGGAAILRRLLDDPISGVTSARLRHHMMLERHLDHPDLRSLVEPTP